MTQLLDIHQAVTELTAPAAAPVTLAEAKTHLRITGTADDTDITAFITAATNHAQMFSGRQCVTARYALKLDEFPTGSEPIRLPKPPLQFVADVQYVDVNGTTQTWGDVVQETRVTPANVESTDEFNILVGGVAIAAFTADAATVANVTAGLTTAWNNSTHDFASGITAVDQTTYIELTGTTGLGFVVTATATDGGGADTQTLAVTETTGNTTLYDVDSDSEPGRLAPAFNQDYPDPREQVGAVTVNLYAGYGAASAVDQRFKVAIKQAVHDIYEHRGINSELRLQLNRMYSDLLWGVRVLDVA